MLSSHWLVAKPSLRPCMNRRAPWCTPGATAEASNAALPQTTNSKRGHTRSSGQGIERTSTRSSNGGSKPRVHARPATPHADTNSAMRPTTTNADAPAHSTHERSKQLTAATNAAAVRQLTDRELLRWERDGFIVVRGLLDASTMHSLQQAADDIVAAGKLTALQHRVRVLCPDVREVPQSEARAMQLLEKHGTDSVGFLQFFHNWRTNEAVRAAVFSQALTGVAAQLLGVKRLRLYQDCLFRKEPGYSETNWHSDLRMAPFDTNHALTAWIPTRRIGAEPPAPAASSQGSGRAGGGGKGRGRGSGLDAAAEEDSGLMYAVGSHRDFALPFWHSLESKDLGDRGYSLRSTGPMEPGDVSFHHGWLLHCAGPQPKGTQPRSAYAVAYFADGARLLRRSDPSVRASLLHNEDADSYQSWLPQLKDGAVAAHPEYLPLVLPAGVGSKQ